ncbi:serine hydrolase [Bacillus spongiae]|uniref:serine-type D-Ala-D-Ala carboxypeptidase n=1 Tax=Bacillus spongiae TaxID=2683610 RepID=A0ABU8HKR2_9BACI
MKKQWCKKIVAGTLAFFLAFGLFQLPQSASAEEALNINAQAAILVDAKSGKILYEKNSDTALGIASMTKMMTEFLLLEAVEEGRLSFDQKYTVSDYVYKVSQDTSLSNVPLKVGEQYTIQELYEAMAIYSANGATIAIAEKIAGTEANFVKMMNEKAEELGLDNYHFVNSTGLNNADLFGLHPEGTGAEDENTMSAKATATLAFELINQYPEVLETSSIPKKWFRPGIDDEQTEMDNWNFMLPSLVFEYEGIDGIKTGTTDFAGSCFTGTAERNGMRFITVVMDAKPPEGVIPPDKSKPRFDETRKMLDFAFSNFSVEELVPAGYEVDKQKNMPVVKGKEDKVGVISEAPITAMVRNGEKDKYKPVFTPAKKALNEEGELEAPIKKDQAVGTLTVEYDGEDLGYLTPKAAESITVNMVADKSVEKANWFVLSLRAIGGFFVDVWNSVVSGIKGLF